MRNLTEFVIENEQNENEQRTCYKCRRLDYQTSALCIPLLSLYLLRNRGIILE
jgi:hypothetical protein